ncbi:MAG: threonine synthase [Spirochaetales bacterium]|nr:threonine synthase [Spirochaetales bacterium]
MKYLSTRGNWHPALSKEVIRTGMVPKGGLFVPESFPQLSLDHIKTLKGYQETAFYILSKYLSDYTDQELHAIIAESYSSNFTHKDIAPLKKITDDCAILELWHGPTAAFKDMALQIMPRLLVHSMASQKDGMTVMILVATSGDTGKAALEGFKNVANTRILCFYPEEGVSLIQKYQMNSTDGQNTVVVGVRGNFDDCQTAVKAAFANEALREKAEKAGYSFSSANSINWGRLVPQIVYYVWGYKEMEAQGLLKWGEPMNVAVPTGNFGNILAAYYAMRMGLPINQFICASNQNNILTDFIKSGEYNTKRDFHVTMSPSMDILISSNLERLIFELLEKDGQKVSALYDDLKNKSTFKLTGPALNQLQQRFYGDFTSEEETQATIAKVFKNHHYLLDTHTAVGYHAVEKYRAQTKDLTPCMLTATANPYKFPLAVLGALSDEKLTDDFLAVEKLHALSSENIHPQLVDIKDKALLHKRVVSLDELASVIENELYC